MEGTNVNTAVNTEEKLASNQVVIEGKKITFMFTPTSYYLDMQTKAQGAGGKFLLKKYAEEILKRVEEDYTVNDFTPMGIQDVIEAFDNFCNAPRV